MTFDASRSRGLSPFGRKPFGGLNANTLRLLAFGLMLLDHLWASIVPGNDWMTWLGRMALPIFAFQIAEGFFHTSDVNRYMKRLALFAVITEVPFNLFLCGSPFFPFHQNVLWTLLLGLAAIRALERARQEKTVLALLRGVALAGLCCFLATICFMDYGALGVATVLLFYLLRGFPLAWLAQLVAMVLLHEIWFKGQFIPVELFGHSFEFVVQGFAVAALIPIWLYNGKKGIGGKAAQYAAYAFYPGHLLILYLMMQIL